MSPPRRLSSPPACVGRRSARESGGPWGSLAEELRLLGGELRVLAETGLSSAPPDLTSDGAYRELLLGRPPESESGKLGA